MTMNQEVGLKNIFSIPLDEKMDTGVKPSPIIQEAYRNVINEFKKHIGKYTVKNNEYLLPIKIPSSEKEISEKVMVAGGCLSDYFIAKNEGKEYTFKDIDFFISSETLHLIGLGSFEDTKKDELVDGILIFLKNAFPDADNIENKFKEFQQMYDFVSYRLIFGVNWKGTHIELIFHQEKINVENFDLSFRKFYYRGDNIICYKSSLDAIEKKELNLLGFHSIKNSFFRIERFNSSLGYNLDRFSKIFLFLALRETSIQDLKMKEHPLFNSEIPPDFGSIYEFIAEQSKKIEENILRTIDSIEEHILNDLRINTQHFDNNKIDLYVQTISECKECFDALSSKEKSNITFLFNETLGLDGHIGAAKERFVFFLENDVDIELSEILVPVEEYNDKEIWDNKKIFGNTPKEIINNALVLFKRKLKLEKIYNESTIDKIVNSNFSYYNAEKEIKFFFPFISPSIPFGISIEILDRMLNDGLDSKYFLTTKQNISFSFNKSKMIQLLSGYSIDSYVQFADSKHPGNFNFTLQWNETEKMFNLFSFGDFLYLDSSRLKSISEVFEKELGFPVQWVFIGN
jgi:hypothetical protein